MKYSVSKQFLYNFESSEIPDINKMKIKSKFYRKANSISRSLLSNKLNGRDFKFDFAIPELIVQNKGLFARKEKSFVIVSSPGSSNKLSPSKSLNLDDIANRRFRFDFNVVKSANFRGDGIINYPNCQKMKLKIKALFFKRARSVHSNSKNNFKFQFEVETLVDERGEA